ncbi:MAG: MATE family efflux transporter [Alphaproteobacteria bacterium]|nr:MATE family efflux transporter [Alphaproteobacteria bacterium]MBQ7285864.1 MATE family efflux transporter [Alphaproteobacteria bacterium]
MIYTYKNIWQVTAPILIGLIIHQLIGITDTVFLGHLSEIELGASALGSVFYIVLFMLGHGFSTGVQIIIARRHGENKNHKIAAVFYQSTFFLITTAILIIAATYLLSRPILSLIISSPKILEATIAYVNPRVWGLIFAFIMVNFRAFFVGITQTKVLTFNAIVMLVTNVVLDYGMIFGNLGMPMLGIAGSAYASVISEAASAIFFISYLLMRMDWKKFGFNKIVWMNKHLFRDIFDLSFWTTMQSVIGLATWLFFLIAIENLGEKELAVSNILRSISSLIFMIINALAATANSLTSNLIGSGNSKEILPTARRIIQLAYLIGIPTIFLLIIGYQQILSVYTSDANLTAGIFTPYVMMLSSYLTLVPGMVWLSVISGSGRTKLGMNLELLCLVLYVFSVWYIVLYSRANLTWCWSCEHYYNIPLWFVTYRYLKKIRHLSVKI